MSKIKAIRTNIDAPGFRYFKVNDIIFNISFVITSCGTPGYLVSRLVQDGLTTIPIPADRVTGVIYADGSQVVSGNSQYRRTNK